jgi:hypothetical protein
VKSAPARNDKSAWHEGEENPCRSGQCLLTDGVGHLDASGLMEDLLKFQHNG